MLRALSTCRNYGGYERLVDEPVNLSLLDGKLKRAKSVPASVFGSSKSRKLGPELALQNISPAKPSSRKTNELQIKEQSMELGLQWKEDLMLSV
ncbi:hypothetical protein OIU84_030101 [Salix udensis]|uniref:Uncharacterized protein n=1 Tax=Salix udensis TaxID=889485 RepID=A0AAD6P944_9ROSI|nr:hypothetical protein OIU84_030101 [Salix udensis]